jgi:hypothetical protein
LVLGERGGVSILRPNAKPKHFSAKELRKAIAEVVGYRAICK